MGNYQTIAPEMRKTGKDLSTEDYKRADIYALGVTIWMILAQDKHGFYGEYSQTQKELLEHELHREKIVLADIHQIIEGCTRTLAHERINLSEVITILHQVESSLIHYDKYIDGKWKDVCNKLNPFHASKIELTEIKAIYQFIHDFYGFEPDLHHAFFPNGGGLDIHGIELNEKDEFIIINMSGFRTWIKPKRLVYKHFSPDISNNYIYLETDEIPFFPNYSQSQTVEYTLINNEFLTDSKHWEYNLFEEMPLPTQSSRVTFVHNGNFLFVKHSSFYNKHSPTYDGRHSKKFKTFEEFDDYFCNTFLTYREISYKTKLPFEFRNERLNISPSVNLLFLSIEDISEIIYGLKFEKYGDEFGILPSSELFDSMMLQLELEKENEIHLRNYDIDKIREFWCLYNLGKQYGWTIEMSTDFYHQFYEIYSNYKLKKLSDKISSKSQSALIDFINRALKNLKHNELLTSPEPSLLP